MEEFRRHSPPPGLINKLKRKLASPEPPVDRFTLPAVPAEWNPTSVSCEEKVEDIVEKAKRTKGLPDTDDAYYSPAVVAERERQRASEEASNRRKTAIMTIVEHAGKPYNKLTHVEVREWREKLNIDPLTEEVRPPPATKKPAKKRPTGLSSGFTAKSPPRSPTKPAKNSPTSHPTGSGSPSKKSSGKAKGTSEKTSGSGGSTGKSATPKVIK